MAKLETHTAKAVRQAPAKEIAEKLGALVLARLLRRQRQSQPTPRTTPYSPTPAGYFSPVETLPAGSRSKRRSPRRLGRIRFYEPTAKIDVSRLGTFRHYMISTIRQHDNTRAAEQAHQLCTDPKYAKNRLDFNWAADEGFITWK